MDKLKMLRDKKGASKMHPMERKAKMGVVEDMRDMANAAMGNKLRGMNKVTVASDSPEGLEHGLDKAHDVLSHLPVALDDSHPDHENFAHSENEEDGEDGLSAYPDADDDHPLERDPAAAHMKDEEAEEGHEQSLAEGGEVAAEGYDESAEPAHMPDYHNMDEGEMSAHLHQLVAALKQKGLA